MINLPTFDLIDAVIGIGNTHGPEVDEFAKFCLTPAEATKVGAPLIAECYANFEFEVVKAHVATSPRYPTTMHYRGDGVFMVSGRNVNYRKRFKSVNL